MMRPSLPLTLLVLVLSGCASSPTPSGPALEPAEPTDRVEEAPKQRPALDKLLSTLKGLGYDGVGLEFESDATLELLSQVFGDPRSSQRRIKLIYTGAQLSYDRAHQSLTIGGTNDPQAILAYIQKNVPVR